MSQLAHTTNARRNAARPDLLVFPGQPGWDEARRAWNLAVAQRPAAVAVPESVDDVVAAVDHARAVGLRVAVQGTGHGAGSASLDGTLLINMARLTGVDMAKACLDAFLSTQFGGGRHAGRVEKLSHPSVRQNA